MFTCLYRGSTVHTLHPYHLEMLSTNNNMHAHTYVGSIYPVCVGNKYAGLASTSKDQTFSHDTVYITDKSRFLLFLSINEITLIRT